VYLGKEAKFSIKNSWNNLRQNILKQQATTCRMVVFQIKETVIFLKNYLIKLGMNSTTSKEAT
jgi:hypothetical protein